MAQTYETKPTIEELQEQLWRREWQDGQKAALDKLERGPAYEIWQQADGMWRVGRWGEKTVPAYYREYDYGLAGRGKIKPDMKVSAFGWHDPIGPEHKTEQAARAWLKRYVNPKRIGFDAAGNEVSVDLEKQA